MTDHDEIYLQPECCADPAHGRVWCEHDAPEDCADGIPWTRYVRADRYTEPQAEIDRLKADVFNANSEMERAHLENDALRQQVAQLEKRVQIQAHNLQLRTIDGSMDEDQLIRDADMWNKYGSRLLVLATKHCSSDHHDWQEILNLSAAMGEPK